jgi:uncharacterized protein YbcV (DUF1398 family)
LLQQKQTKHNMFTLEQIKAALSEVKTGADFPAYIRNVRKLGVTFYETFLVDGHTVYHGKDGLELTSAPRYSELEIASVVNAPQLRADIRHHQEGGSDYFQISTKVAGSGIVKWAVCMDTMTCTYYDEGGNKVMVEAIPVI